MEKTHAQILGENLERIRKEKGYTRKQLAEVVNVNEISFGAYERGKTLIPLDKIFALANFLQVSVGSLTGENNFADNIPNVDKIVADKIFEYRLKKAWKLTEFLEPEFNSGGIFGHDTPDLDDNGRIVVYSAEKIEYKDGKISVGGNTNKIAFETEKDFVKVMELAEQNALYRQTNLSTAFREIVFSSMVYREKN